MFLKYLDTGSVFILIISIIIAKLVIHDIIINLIWWVWRTDKMLSGLPLLGDTLSYFKDSESKFGYSLRHLLEKELRLNRTLELAKGHKRNALFKFGLERVVILIEPEDIKNGINNPETLNKTKNYEFLGFALGSGLIGASVPKWMKMRPIVNKAFSYKRLQSYMGYFNHLNKMLMMELSKNTNKEIELEYYYSYINVKSILYTLFDYDGDEDSIRHWIRNMNKLEDVAVELAGYSLRSPLLCEIFNRKNEHGKTLEEFKKFNQQVFETVKQKYYKRKNEGPHEENQDIEDKYDTFIDILLKLMDDGKLTEKEVLDEISSLVGANDLISIVVPTVLLLLAIHPDIQDKVYNELYSVFGDESDRDITWADLNKLKYMDQCINESLRMFPPAPIIARAASMDVHLRKFTIPKGCSILVPIYLIHYNEDVYPEPHKFDPERFTTENTKKRHPNSFIPFSYGHRECVAKKFGLIFMKCMLSYHLRNFYLSSNMKMEDIKLKFNFLLRISQGYNVIIKPRIK